MVRKRLGGEGKVVSGEQRAGGEEKEVVSGDQTAGGRREGGGEWM